MAATIASSEPLPELSSTLSAMILTFGATPGDATLLFA